MMNSGSKGKFGSLIFLLLAIYINLLSFTEAAATPVAATTSSSTSASGLPLPPSKNPAAAPVHTEDVKTVASQTESKTHMSNAQLSSNSHPSLSSSQRDGNSAAATSHVARSNSDIAHLRQGENSANELKSGSDGETSKLMSHQKVSSFVDFPPFSKPISSEPRYQRQRRSYPIPSLTQDSSRFARPDELEFRLDDDRDREELLKLLPIISNNRLGSMMQNDELSPFLAKAEEEAQNDNDDDMDGDEYPIDLGAFQRPVANPYWTHLLSRPSEPINLMSSLLAADSPRANSFSPASRGIYGGGLPIEIASRALRDEDDTNAEWMEDPVPLRGSHFKTRRSGGNTEFTFNPVKSHFRRYMRATPLKSGRGLEFIPSTGHFGPLLPSLSRMNRRRRATSNAIHWM